MLFVFSALSTCAAGAGPPVRVAVFDESVAVPGTRIAAGPVHPGGLLGVALWSAERGIGSHRVQLDVGAYRLAPVESALFALPTWQSTVWVRGRVGLSALVGVGYKHALFAAPAWVVRQGQAERARYAGRPEATARLGVGVEVRASEALSVFLQYRGGLDGPFSAELSPVLLHASSLLGVEVRP